ncbi:glutathione S-transferase family protein [Thauera sp. 2A1]|uniref:glutathione S-transferase family protein n=1 Tax=Thauera sp. 2A1 TaxID=2570191 RepID=UPI001291E504|nr:glutathione S-transferase [Thauera sp. 2A1]KAI5912203.1 glutathione S-transferase [Thauera sp. 2A1]KAI5915027.1 glutathione S-transferase [Thauera sp. 2A1]
MDQLLQLHGTPLSNYYNKVKIALLEMGFAFTEHAHLPNSGSWPGSGSPSGKIPFLVTTEGPIHESQAILEYLEDVRPGVSLYPDDAYRRARCRELIQYLELYVEAPARALYPAAFWGKELACETVERAVETIASGISTLARCAQFEPHLCGESFTHADSVAWVHLNTVAMALKRVTGANPIPAWLPAVPGYLERLAERPSIRHVEDDRRAAARASRG